MSAGIYNITLEKNVDYCLAVTVASGDASLNLSGCAIAAQIRDAPNWPIITEFTTGITSLTGGAFSISLSAANSLALPNATSYYDVLLTYPNGENIRVLQGTVTPSYHITE